MFMRNRSILARYAFTLLVVALATALRFALEGCLTVLGISAGDHIVGFSRVE